MLHTTPTPTAPSLQAWHSPLTPPQRERLGYLLAAGVSQRLAAGTVGITEELLSKAIRWDAALAVAIREAASEIEQEEIELREKQKLLRARLVDKALECADEIISTRDALASLALLQNVMQPAAVSVAGANAASPAMQVTVNLGAAIGRRVNLQISESNAIIAVDDRSMAPLPRDAVQALLEASHESADSDSDSQSYFEQKSAEISADSGAVQPASSKGIEGPIVL